MCRRYRVRRLQGFSCDEMTRMQQREQKGEPCTRSDELVGPLLEDRRAGTHFMSLSKVIAICEMIGGRSFAASNFASTPSNLATSITR